MEAPQLALTGAVMEKPDALLLYIEQEVKVRQIGDDLAVLVVEVLEGSVVLEDVQPLVLVEDHADGAVLEDQPRLTIEQDAHLLIHYQLNK